MQHHLFCCVFHQRRKACHFWRSPHATQGSHYRNPVVWCGNCTLWRKLDRSLLLLEFPDMMRLYSPGSMCPGCSFGVDTKRSGRGMSGILSGHDRPDCCLNDSTGEVAQNIQNTALQLPFLCINPYRILSMIFEESAYDRVRRR